MNEQQIGISGRVAAAREAMDEAVRQRRGPENLRTAGAELLAAERQAADDQQPAPADEDGERPADAEGLDPGQAAQREPGL